MAHRLLWLASLFFLLAFCEQLQAQNTITTQTLSVATTCPGSPLDVPFTRTGTYNANNIFTVQLSDGSVYKDIVTGAVSFNSSTNTYTVSATIPATTPAGTTYSLRVTASNPAVIGTPSTTKLTIKTKPAPPLAPSEVIDCQKSDGSSNVTVSISVTASSPTAITKLYNADGSIADNLYPRPVNDPSFVVSKSSATYFVTQLIEGCESDKREVKVIIKPKANVNVTPLNVYGNTGGQEGPLGRIAYCQGDKSFSLKDFGIQPLPDNITVAYRKESGDLEFNGNPPHQKQIN